MDINDEDSYLGRIVFKEPLKLSDGDTFSFALTITYTDNGAVLTHTAHQNV